MGIGHMLSLTGIQAQILYCIVAWIFINMVNNLARFEVSPDVLLHDQAMFKDVRHTARCIRRVGVSRWGNDENIAVLSLLAPAVPVRVLVASAPIHPIGRAGLSFAVHGIVRPANVSVIRWVAVRQVLSNGGASPRTELARAARPAVHHFPALFAGDVRACFLSIARTSLRAIHRLDRGECFVGFTALSTDPSDHGDTPLLLQHYNIGAA